MRRLLNCVIATLFFSIINGCGVLSVNPISPPDVKNIDDRLVGSWRVIDESCKIFIHVGKSDDQKMRAIFIEHKESGELDTLYFAVHPSKVGQHHFLNLQVTEPEGQISDELKHFILLRYRFKSIDTLVINFISSDKIAKRIEQKELAGYLPRRVRAKKFDNDGKVAYIMKNYIEITDSSENISKFIRHQGADKMFDEELILKRN